MEICVSKEEQAVIVPKEERFYVFARCGCCNGMGYVMADVTVSAESEGMPYTVMAVSGEDERQIEGLLKIADNFEESVVYEEEKNRADSLLNEICRTAERIFAPYLHGIQ